MKQKKLSTILIDNILYICLLCMVIVIAVIQSSFISLRVFSDVISGSLAQEASYYIKFWPGLPELPLIVPVIVTILIGMIVGAVTGTIISKLKVPPFLAGLGMQMILYGANLLLMKKAPNNSQPLAGYKQSFTKFGTGSVAGINYLIIVSVIVMVVVYIILNMTTLGKNIYATGGNREAAQVAGINVYKIDLFVYVLSGALAAFAGCMLAARTGS